MSNKFTAIYNDVWESGIGEFSAARMKRIEQKEGETVRDTLAREEVSDSILFLFHGWPSLQGEIEETPPQA